MRCFFQLTLVFFGLIQNLCFAAGGEGTREILMGDIGSHNRSHQPLHIIITGVDIYYRDVPVGQSSPRPIAGRKGDGKSEDGPLPHSPPVVPIVGSGGSTASLGDGHRSARSPDAAALRLEGDHKTAGSPPPDGGLRKRFMASKRPAETSTERAIFDVVDPPIPDDVDRSSFLGVPITGSGNAAVLSGALSPITAASPMAQSPDNEQAALLGSPASNDSPGGAEINPEDVPLMDALDGLILDSDLLGINSCHRGARIAGGIVGPILAAPPACGVFMYNTADFLELPVDSILAASAITTALVTMAPGHAGQFADMFDRIAHMGTNPYTYSYTNPWVRHVQQISPAHTGMINLMRSSTALNSAARLVQMVQIESPALWFAILTGPFYFAADFDLNYRNGMEEIDLLFFNDVYHTQSLTGLKKAILCQRIDAMKEMVMAESDEEAIRKRHRVVTGEDRITSSGDDSLGMPFRLSFLMAKAFNQNAGLDQKDRLSEGMNLLGRPNIRSKLTANLTTIVMSIGSFGRFEITRNWLAIAVAFFGMDPTAASYFGTVISAITTPVRHFGEMSIHHRNAQGIHALLCTENRTSPDTQAMRGTAGIQAGMTAGIFTLQTIAMGVKTIGASYPIVGAVVLIGTAATMDFSAYYTAFYRNTLYVARAAAARCTPPVAKMKATIIAQCDRAKNLVNRLTDSAISRLWRWVG